MPKLGCPCGYTHNLTPIPDNGFRIVSDLQFIDMPKHTWDLGMLYVCPECKRMLVSMPESKDAAFLSYVLEE